MTPPVPIHASGPVVFCESAYVEREGAGDLSIVALDERGHVSRVYLGSLDLARALGKALTDAAGYA